MKYIINVEETHTAEFEVDASSQEEALKIAENMWENQEGVPHTSLASTSLDATPLD